MPNVMNVNLGSKPWSVDKFHILRVAATIVVLSLILACTFLGTLIHPFVGLTLFVLLTTGFLASSFRVADPEKFQLLLPIFVKIYVARAFGPGFVYLPLTKLLPFLFGFTMIDGKLIVDEGKVQERILREQGKIELTYITRLSADPLNPIPLMRIGGLDRVATIWGQEVTRRIRTWVCSKDEGPLNVDDAREMKDEAVSAILWMIIGDEFQQISGGVEALIGKLNERKPTEIEKEYLKWLDALPKDEQAPYLEMAKEYGEIINSIRNGTEKMTISVLSLGILIHEFAVIDIEPIGETAESMDEINKALNEAKILKTKAQGIKEASMVMSEITNLKDDPFQALMISQGKIPKKIDVTQFDLAQPIIDVLSVDLLKPVSGAVVKWISKKTVQPRSTKVSKKTE